MKVINLSSKSDLIGVAASTLCFLHCLATPLFFVAHAGTVMMEETHPWWWDILDLAFLVISFLAVYWSTRTSSKTLIKYALWFSWVFLLLILLNEKFVLWEWPEETIYLPTIGLISLHVYNHRYSHY